MIRFISVLCLALCLWSANLVLGQDAPATPTPPAGGSNFAASFNFKIGNYPPDGVPVQDGSVALMQGEVIYPPQFQSTLPQGSFASQQLPMPQLQEGVVSPPPVPDTSVIDKWYQNDLFHYSWIDYGEGQGLRLHRLEKTNAWNDIRAINFFNRPIEETNHHFDAGLSFAVQWQNELPAPTVPYPRGPYLPPVLYDVYLDLGWRTALSPTWMIDLGFSPGLSTDFRVTPPDAFRMKGHALAMVDMLPNLRGVLGVWYINRISTKILPVAGFSWQASEATRIEAIFPQPRIIHTLGCWKGSTWEMSVGGEFGGGGWTFKNPENDPESLDYRDLRILFGLGCNGAKGQGVIQAGYVFSRELRYGSQSEFDFNPGNAWMIRVGWDY